ncbi:hypothetical protein [Hymenobacter volaticus]|uniref:Uncharacterized protein n=1 Tax=Hymenobacter volaticus TaxID=2932254 RepID=A0ABY4GEV8_9BACT|nr:hypothetical protein [Hymenobacter volaticus]UOQ69286.1 hypothetical protein MUN86_27940 [Hymenobacter volaticus]UOQ69316.1 hypothetical protein MUN86_26840 [Hymenobacter volaticus]
MANLAPFAWLALYLNLGLNLFGLLTIISCNILHWSCAAIAYYLYAALWLGVPLFILTLWGAPSGTFTRPRLAQARRYRRLFLLNLGIVALLFIPAVVAVFF